VLRPAFFRRCVLFGDIGFGESYVEGEWETDSIERVISWAILNLENAPNLSGSRVRHLGLNLLKFYNRALHLFRPNRPAQARRNIAEHYDLGNDFYQLWLDPGLTYSAALFSSPDQTLADAQTAKYEALCRKLHLRPGDRVLEIGGGWGGFASHAVQHHGCHVTTVTISRAQYDHARARFAREGLVDRIELRLQDFRQITGRFDKIVSIEMMEALGDRYLGAFCAKLDEVLAPDGLAGLQYITVPDTRYEELRRGVDWIQKHVFPGSILLSVGRVNATLNRTSNLFLHDLEDLGASYARTLRVWQENFARQQEAVRRLGFDERFARKWNYYLQYCEAAFARRNISVVQAIYTRPNNPRLAAGW
jgi:cyclopropane-fatty-acyl-phospholipid synthase